MDIGGVVNAYYTHTSFSGDDATAGERGNGDSVANITTGLLPNYLAVSGKTRQNDLDVAFTISINPGASTKNAGIQSAQQENRQAFLTFGDKSWGSIKLGKDLGIYASDAILNDMTLLGVGSAAGGLLARFSPRRFLARTPFIRTAPPSLRQVVHQIFTHALGRVVSDFGGGQVLVEFE